MPLNCAATMPKFLNVPSFSFQTLWPIYSRFLRIEHNNFERFFVFLYIPRLSSMLVSTRWEWTRRWLLFLVVRGVVGEHWVRSLLRWDDPVRPFWFDTNFRIVVHNSEAPFLPSSKSDLGCGSSSRCCTVSNVGLPSMGLRCWCGNLALMLLALTRQIVGT